MIADFAKVLTPAHFKSGTHKSVLVASVPKENGRPNKYPRMYRGVDALVINEVNLLPYIPFEMDYFRRGIEVPNPRRVTFLISCKTWEGIGAWIE